MKIKVIALASALIMVVASFVVVIASTPKHNANLSSSITSAQKTGSYYLRAFDNRIGIFKAGSDQPEQIINVYISSLPPEVQDQINAGIFCKDNTELLQRIEDFTS